MVSVRIKHLHSTHSRPLNQAPPQITEGAPSPCMNISEGHSSSRITTVDHHPDANSSNHSILSNRGTVVAATQGYATSNSSTVTQISDQLPACASPSHNQANQSDQSDDEDPIEMIVSEIPSVWLMYAVQ